MAEHWVDVGAEEDLAQRPLVADADGIGIVVVRCAEGDFAIEDRCTHDGEALGGGEVEDCEIICPRHFARFCLKTGEPLSPPAYEPVHTYPVRTENGRVLVQIPD